MKPFKKSIGNLDGDLATRLIASTMDVALVMDRDGVVRDFSVGDDTLAREDVFASLIGKPWIDTVTEDSRVKVAEMIRDAGARGVPRWRQVNHPSSTGSDLPIRYSTLGLGANGRILAVGRELRSMSALQQSLVSAQQAMEREYSRHRLSETRYRLLFETASEAVVIADATTLKIVELNPAAAKLFERGAKRKAGRTLYDFLDSSSAAAVRALVQSVRSSGRAETARVHLAVNETEAIVSGSMFRQDAASFLLLRISPVTDAPSMGSDAAGAVLSRVVEGIPDGFVVADANLKILTANMAFLEFAQLAAEEQVRGQSLDRWLGRTPVDLETLTATATSHGVVRNFSTIMRGEYGSIEDVEVSAVHVADADAPCFGLTIRAAGQRAASDPADDLELPRSVKQLTRLVGQVPLKNLVRETTDLIERLCIEAALELVGDNRASAAEMLGLSRQSLYVKLRRYGLGDLDNVED